MTTPTHYRFEFDAQGAVVLAGRYMEDDLGPDDSVLYEPKLAPATRGAIVPGDMPVYAETAARVLVEGQGGYDA